MNTANREPNANLRRLSDMGDYGIPDDRPDVRGWHIDDDTGRSIGKVDDLVVDTGAMRVRYLELTLDRKVLNLRTERDKHVIVPVEHAHLDRANRRVRIAGMTAAAAAALPEFSGTDYDAYPGRWDTSDKEHTAKDGQTLTRAEEELRIGTRQRTGEVRARKHVETEHVREDVPVRREEVYVERRPVSGGEMRAAAIGEDEIVVPISEEEVTVEKRPVVKEELVIGKRTTEDIRTVEADVRRERIDIDESSNVEGRDVPKRDRTR